MSTNTSRRGALKLIGIGLGGAAVVPSVLLQACKEAATAVSYTYSTFSPEQVALIKAIQDAIIPRTDTPSATDVGSAEFLDTYVAYGFTAEEKETFAYRMGKLMEAFKASGNTTEAEPSSENVTSLLQQYYVDYVKPTEEDQSEIVIEGNTIDQNSGADDKSVVRKDDATELNELLKMLKSKTMESYFASEKIGEEVLNYLEVPGEYIGQLPMSEVPNGRAWSL